MNNERKINERKIKKIKQYLPTAEAEYNSGLPYVGVLMTGDTLFHVEQVVFALQKAKINPPFLFDQKDNYLEVRYAITRSQKKLLMEAIHKP